MLVTVTLLDLEELSAVTENWISGVNNEHMQLCSPRYHFSLAVKLWSLVIKLEQPAV